jgi:flagellar basal-body rod protein FlgG
MIENLNVAASGMLAQQQRIAAVANDLANASTTGYKHTRVGFRDLVYNPADRAQSGSYRAGAGVAMTDAGRGFAQGSLENTGNPLDVAIQGEGFLQVKLPDGRKGLTRDGDLQVDAKGRLSTSNGLLIEPRITVPAGTAQQDISIGKDGSVRAAGKQIGKLQLLNVRSPQQLESVGTNAFVATTASGKAVQASATSFISQGAIEASNVDMGDEMVEMIDAQRSYQIASKAITTADEMMQIANGIRR